ncbi:unnamed protein product, partial [Ectocarpus sp. 4 AP-2014]
WKVQRLRSGSQRLLNRCRRHNRVPWAALVERLLRAPRQEANGSKRNTADAVKAVRS